MGKRDVSPGNRDDGSVEHEEESGVAVEDERRARFPDNNAKTEQLVSLCEMYLFKKESFIGFVFEEIRLKYTFDLVKQSINLA
ncbi:putative nucleosome assembly protein [Venturia inaequalis]|nr:putative nucleosome assembly protein [Venturia inaequalis]